MKYVLLCSGGMDSTVLLWDLLDRGHEVTALGIDYGQRHRRELEAAAEICNTASEKLRPVEFRIADLGGISQFLSGNALISSAIDVPSGHYADETMKLTIVPNRNMLMLAVATSWALSSGADRVAYAAHAGDHTIYPDCRPEFIAALAKAISLADWRKVELEAPFQDFAKSDICRRGAELEAPLAITWSCYKGGNKHCGICGTCTERKEAFLLSNVPDPTEYEIEA